MSTACFGNISWYWRTMDRRANDNAFMARMDDKIGRYDWRTGWVKP